MFAPMPIGLALLALSLAYFPFLRAATAAAMETAATR